MIKKTKLDNTDDAFYKEKCGSDTSDSVFVLSMENVLNVEYGFDGALETEDMTRRCSTTPYAKANVVRYTK